MTCPDCAAGSQRRLLRPEDINIDGSVIRLPDGSVEYLVDHQWSYLRATWRPQVERDVRGQSFVPAACVNLSLYNGKHCLQAHEQMIAYSLRATCTEGLERYVKQNADTIQIALYFRSEIVFEAPLRDLLAEGEHLIGGPSAQPLMIREHLDFGLFVQHSQFHYLGSEELTISLGGFYRSPRCHDDGKESNRAARFTAYYRASLDSAHKAPSEGPYR